MLYSDISVLSRWDWGGACVQRGKVREYHHLAKTKNWLRFWLVIERFVSRDILASNRKSRRGKRQSPTTKGSI